MHPVIKHILARKNKKVPVNDGRKIGLCLFGGSMAGIRGMGALAALEELGLTNSFDSIYTYSAGFPNACYFLAHQTKLAASVYYYNLPEENFINFRRFWNIADVKILIRALKNEKPLLLRKVIKSKTKLYNRFVKNGNEIEYKEVHSMSKNFWKFMQAATSSPIVSPGKVRINSQDYKDIGLLGNHWNDHLKYAISSDLTDILSIYCYPSQAKKDRPKSKKMFEIVPPKKWKMSQFETDREILQKNCLQMGLYVKSIFGVNKPIELDAEKYANINYNGKNDTEFCQTVRVSAKNTPPHQTGIVRKR